jgi:hypothetical protein
VFRSELSLSCARSSLIGETIVVEILLLRYAASRRMSLWRFCRERTSCQGAKEVSTFCFSLASLTRHDFVDRSVFSCLTTSMKRRYQLDRYRIALSACSYQWRITWPRRDTVLSIVHDGSYLARNNHRSRQFT